MSTQFEPYNGRRVLDIIYCSKNDDLHLSHFAFNEPIMKNTLPVHATALCMLFALPCSSHTSATPPVTDADWVSAGQAQGVDMYITALTVDEQGDLIATGDFSSAGGLSAENGVAKWDGSVWSVPWNKMVDRAGDTLPYRSESSTPVCVGNNGTVFIGGDGVYASDGSTFRAILDNSGKPDEIEGDAFVMIFHDGILYAAGEFDSGGKQLPDIMQWDGISWSLLSGGILTQSGYNEITVLAVDSFGTLYAGGTFSSDGNTTTNHVAKWNGAAWIPLGNGFPFNLTALAADRQGNVYIGGYEQLYMDNTYRYLKSIVKWNGVSLEPIETSTEGSITSLICDSAGNLYAGGDFNSIGGVAAQKCAQWNGTVWQPLGTGVEGRIAALAIGKNGILYAGGEVFLQEKYFIGKIAQWNGTRWSALGRGKGFCSNIDKLVIDKNGTLFAGRQDYMESMYLPSLLRMGPDGWMRLGYAVGEDGAAAILSDNNGGLYAGGTNVSSTTNGLAHWNGSEWSGMGIHAVYTIEAMVLDNAENFYAAGEFNPGRDTAWGNIARYNGATWNKLSKGLNGTVSALAVDGRGIVYAGGEFDSASGTPALHIAKWDGVSWSALGSGLAGNCRTCSKSNPCTVRSLVFDASGNLFAGGTFETAGGQPAACVAQWDGTTWNPLGQGIYGTKVPAPNQICRIVATLLFDNEGNLFAGGSFDSAGSVAARNIARWDGTTWVALGSGCNNVVSGMAIDKNGVLHVGGGFDSAGGVFSSRYAMCKVTRPDVELAVVAALPGGSSIGNGAMRIHLYTQTLISIRLYTLSGREVRRSQKMMCPGEHVINVATDNIGRGAYIVRVDYGNSTGISRILVKR